MQRVEDGVAKNCSLIWLLCWWPRFYYLQQEKQTKSYSIKSCLSTTQEKRSSKDGCFYILSSVLSQSSNARFGRFQNSLRPYFSLVLLSALLSINSHFPCHTALWVFSWNSRMLYSFLKYHLCFFRCLNSRNHVILTPSSLLFFLPIASICQSTIISICV